jgi:hypothetical protein
MAADRDATRREFREAVNMTRRELERWLRRDGSRDVGATPSGEAKHATGGAESVGHRSGRRIVQILGTRKGDLSDADYAHMRKVVGYVRRHLAQKPAKEPVEDSRWRRSLMNWGHDPLGRGGRGAR